MKESFVKNSLNAQLLITSSPNKINYLNQNLENEEKNCLANTKMISSIKLLNNLQEDNITKSTQFTFNQSSSLNFRNVSSKLNPYEVKSKDIASRFDNSPIKNMDLSPFKNPNYVNQLSSEHQKNLNSIFKVNLNAKLETGHKSINIHTSNNDHDNEKYQFFDKNNLHPSPRSKNLRFDQDCLLICENNLIDSPKFFNEIQAAGNRQLNSQSGMHSKKANFNNKNNNNNYDNENIIFADNNITTTNRKEYFPQQGPSGTASLQSENPLNKLITYPTSNSTNNNNDLFKYSINPNNCFIQSTGNNKCSGLKNLNFLTNPFANSINNKDKEDDELELNKKANLSFSPTENIGSDMKINEKNFNNNKIKSENSEIDYTANESNIPSKYNQNFFKGNFNFYNNYEDMVVAFKNPFDNEQNCNSQNKLSKVKRLEASIKLDTYEKDNATFINNQLNYKEVNVAAHIDNKPSLTLAESRNRLNVFTKTKTYKEDFISNLNQNFANKNSDNCQNKPITIFTDQVTNADEKQQKKTSTEIIKNDLSTRDNCSGESQAFLKKLKKLNEKACDYEMIEEIDVEDEKSLYMGHKSAQEEILSASEKEDNNTLSLDSTSNKLNFSDCNLSENCNYPKSEAKKAARAYSPEQAKKKIPDNSEMSELIKAYPELLIACRFVDEAGKKHYDYNKFVRLIEEEINLVVPLEKKNDEIFKRKIIAKKLQTHKFSENQSARRSDSFYGKSYQESLEEGI